MSLTVWFHVLSRGYGPQGVRYTLPPVLTSSGGLRSGWYASYWNALLLKSEITNGCCQEYKLKQQNIQIESVTVRYFKSYHKILKFHFSAFQQSVTSLCYKISFRFKALHKSCQMPTKYGL